MKKTQKKPHTAEKNVEEQKKVLYTYWKDLQFSKVVNSEDYDLLVKSDVKNFIIKYIRDGLVDEFGKKYNLSRRHAFSAKELYNAYSLSSNSKEYSLSNFHFHIKSLVKDGFIKEIIKILEGRQYISYYGRTAISFTFNYDKQIAETMRQNIFDPLKVLIKNLNPEMENDQINQLLDDNLRYLQDFYFRVRLWMKDNYPQLYKSKFDLQSFFEIIGQYSFLHKRLFDNLSTIGSLISLDQIMMYEPDVVENEQKSTFR